MATSRGVQVDPGLPADVSKTAQDYLRAIYKLQSSGVRATTSVLASRMNVTPPSATSMIKRLAGLGLVEHAPYRGASLTKAGERVALELVRRHRLLELYLSESLGLGIDSVHAEADRLEHSLSAQLEAHIDRRLGHPSHDPHGDPIPDRTLKVEELDGRLLVELEPGEEATIRRVPDGEPELLRYLSQLSLVPGQRVRLLVSAPFGGPMTLLVEGSEHAISREVAVLIGVA